uniref:Geranylgeranyl transferase type-2 subunit alpha n=1 Tax=Steinernema glaseri TaxID=37863 RepID=A0A1I7ZPA6_9BILA
EEERAAIEAELAKKLRILTALLEKIQKKIDSQELDDEFLALTAQVLRKSPNIQTLFNIRRDALLKMMEKKEEESDEEWKARVGQLCNVELSLCVEALKKDCKSYTAWFHRFWAFERHPNRDVSAEIKNCDLALTVDQRNFHAWDHLRSVARLAQLGSQEAVDFSTKRLTHDVSNYSAYHYRATELPNVRPDTVHGMKINIEALKEEIALVNGCGATEPKDQSPWRYALWLLDQATSDHRK